MARTADRVRKTHRVNKALPLRDRQAPTQGRNTRNATAGDPEDFSTQSLPRPSTRRTPDPTGGPALDTDASSRHPTPLERRHMWSTRAFKAVLAFAVLDAFAGWLRPDTLPPHPYDVVSTIALAVVISLTFFSAQSTRLRLDSRERSDELARLAVAQAVAQAETRAEVAALRTEVKSQLETLAADHGQIFDAFARAEKAGRSFRDEATFEFPRPVLVPVPAPRPEPIRAVAAVAIKKRSRRRRQGGQQIPQQRTETPPADPDLEPYLGDASQLVQLGRDLQKADEDERRRRDTA